LTARVATRLEVVARLGRREGDDLEVEPELLTSGDEAMYASDLCAAT